MVRLPRPDQATTDDGVRWALESSRGFAPTGFVRLSMRTTGERRAHGRLIAELSDGSFVHCYELADLAPAATVDRVVLVRKDTRRLVLELSGRAQVERLEIDELGSVPLLVVLASRWLRRQVQRPGRLGPKVARTCRILLTRGPRAVWAALVAAQMSSQEHQFHGDLLEAAILMDESGGRRARRERELRVAKQRLDTETKQNLLAFLASGERLSVSVSEGPATSIVVVTRGRADLTLACLRSIIDNAGGDAEAVIVDNASTDATAELLERVDGATVVRNDANLGFVTACRQGVDASAGEAILLLNNDARLLPGSLQAALAMLEQEDVGVVGGPILAVDGRLQDAGNIVWSDGSCKGYGRGDHPDRPEYRFRREVDFVSGACLLTPRRVWDALGGFDEAFSPGYYEDVDFCLRVRAKGLRVAYEPGAGASHYEHGSSTDPSAARLQMARNRELLVARHAGTLATQLPPSEANLLAARSPRRRRVLVIDDRVPLWTLGSGAPRVAAMLEALVDLELDVTLYPMLAFPGTWSDVYRAVPEEVEVALGRSRSGLRRFLAERAGHYDDVIVSRVHNLEFVLRLRRRHPGLLAGARLVYDAEAVTALREIAAHDVRQTPLPPDRAEALLRHEVDAAREADQVLCVSAYEREVLVAGGVAEAHLVGHSLGPTPTPAPFQEREGLLFVGVLADDQSPNVDGLQWFLEEVLPLVRRRLGLSARLAVAGRTGSMLLRNARHEGVQLLGAVEDLLPLYDRARVFVAPTRFSAGVPLKVYEAAAHGVPVVATELLARQLGWEAGEDLLAVPATDPAAFADACIHLHNDRAIWESIRERALRRVSEECAPSALRAALEGAITPNAVPRKL